MVYNVFCANEQQITKHEHLQDPNNEVLLVCTSCGRMLKFPAGLGKQEFLRALRNHKKFNTLPIVVPAPVFTPLPIPDATQIKTPWWKKLF